uniref:Putative iron/sulfur-binding protein n=1 Tax=Sterolibacterium denitrificans TaxID=157592 RepID=A9XWD5_9PROT|nr:putative iron/sulfur-binding protein [Sterolibacterium denitrificans]
MLPMVPYSTNCPSVARSRGGAERWSSEPTQTMRGMPPGAPASANTSFGIVPSRSRPSTKRMLPRKCTPNIISKPCAVRIAFGGTTPALRITRSSLTPRSRSSAQQRSIAAKSARSRRTISMCGLPVSRFNSSAVSGMPLRHARISRAPSPARMRAVPSPRPEFAPVMRHVMPSSRSCGDNVPIGARGRNRSRRPANVAVRGLLVWVRVGVMIDHAGKWAGISSRQFHVMQRIIRCGQAVMLASPASRLTECAMRMPPSPGKITRTLRTLSFGRHRDRLDPFQSSFHVQKHEPVLQNPESGHRLPLARPAARDRQRQPDADHLHWPEEREDLYDAGTLREQGRGRSLLHCSCHTLVAQPGRRRRSRSADRGQEWTLRRHGARG